MNLGRIVVSNVKVVKQDRHSAVVMADFTYCEGLQCNSSKYDFEMRLIYETSNKRWLFYENEYK